MADAKQEATAATIVGASIVACSIFLIVFGNTAAKGSAAQQWPVTSARVTKGLEIREISYGRGQDADHRIEFNVAYVYTVAGEEYSGETFAFHPDTFLFSFRQNHFNSLIEQYKSGATVPVSYNPVVPSESVLQTKTSLELWISIGFLALFEVVMVGVFVSKQMWKPLASIRSWSDLSWSDSQS